MILGENGNPDEIVWFLLTSSNLSKAAWGCLEKKGQQLMIRSYELGVLVFPNLFRENADDTVIMLNTTTNDPFPCQSPDAEKRANIIVPVRLPYDLPLTPYEKDEQAWVWNIPRFEQDSVGEQYLLSV